MTHASSERFDFRFLQQQIDEQLIVEDELDLARIAILVPELCAALARCVEATRAAEQAMLSARTAIEAISRPE